MIGNDPTVSPHPRPRDPLYMWDIDPAAPNLLFILADDHPAYLLGCDGDRRASTPNLDALAARGARFTKNYCNAPVCFPSRQSMLTGLLPDPVPEAVRSESGRLEGWQAAPTRTIRRPGRST